MSLSLPSPTPSPSGSHTLQDFSPYPSPSSPSSSPSLSPSPSPTPTSPSDTPTPTPTPTLPSSSSTAPLTSGTSSATSSASAVSPPIDQPPSSVTTTTSATDAGVLYPASVSNTLTSNTATPSSTSHPSSSDFFSNKGAVASTFTVVGLVGVAVIIALVMFIARRRAKLYEEDTEFLDKNPDPSADPPMTHVTSMDDISASDHGHYGAPPMVLASSHPVFYDHPQVLPQPFQAESFSQSPSHGYPLPYPAGHAQQYPTQYMYYPEDYDIAYPPAGPPNITHPHDLAGVRVESVPAPYTRAVLPDVARPSTKSTLTVPAQRADSRFSVDSFYAGIAPDSAAPAGQAL